MKSNKFKEGDRVKSVSMNREGTIYYVGTKVYDVALDGSNNLTFIKEEDLVKVKEE